MVELQDYELFVDYRTSKSGKSYTGLYIKIEDKEQLICFISNSLYDYIVSLSS